MQPGQGLIKDADDAVKDLITAIKGFKGDKDTDGLEKINLCVALIRKSKEELEVLNALIKSANRQHNAINEIAGSKIFSEKGKPIFADLFNAPGLLSAAIETGNIAVISILLKEGALVRMEVFQSVIRQNNSAIIKLCLSWLIENRRGDFTREVDVCLHAGLRTAIQQKNHDLIRELMKSGALVKMDGSDIRYDIFRQNSGDSAVLFLKDLYEFHSKDSNVSATEIKTEVKTEIKTVNVDEPLVRSKETVLILAVKNGDLDSVKYLLNLGADPNYEVGGIRVIFCAAIKGDLEATRRVEILKALQASKIKPFKPDQLKKHDFEFRDQNNNYSGRRQPILFHAVHSCELIVIKQLISMGADIDQRVENGVTIIEYMMRHYQYIRHLTELVRGLCNYFPQQDLQKCYNNYHYFNSVVSDLLAAIDNLDILRSGLTQDNSLKLAKAARKEVEEAEIKRLDGHIAHEVSLLQYTKLAHNSKKTVEEGIEFQSPTAKNKSEKNPDSEIKSSSEEDLGDCEFLQYVAHKRKEYAAGKLTGTWSVKSETMLAQLIVCEREILNFCRDNDIRVSKDPDRKPNIIFIIKFFKENIHDKNYKNILQDIYANTANSSKVNLKRAIIVRLKSYKLESIQQSDKPKEAVDLGGNTNTHTQGLLVAPKR